MHIVSKFFKDIFNYIFPSACAICNKPIFSEPKVCDECCTTYLSGNISKISGYKLFSFIKYNPDTRGYYLSIKTNEIFIPESEFDRFISQFKESINKNHLIVPVPSKSSDLPERIAQKIADTCGGTLEKMLVAKIRKHAQKEVKKIDREKNVHNAFSIDKKKLICYNPKKTSKIILVDDMKTTGATLREVCRVMKKENLKIDFLITFAYRDD